MVPKFKEEEVEFALRMLNLPDREGNLAFREWICEGNHRELFRKLLALREAGMIEYNVDKIDAGQMWRQFNRKTRVQTRREMWIWAASAAAMLIIGCGIYGLIRMQKPVTPPVLAQVEYNLGKGVILVAEEEPEKMKKAVVPKVKDIPGVKTFVQDSLQGISYSDVVKEESEEVKYHTLRVPRAADYMVILEDSTCVWVNAESELRYPAHFEGDERIVELKGEAYFKVRHDTSHPFIVRTDRAETRVLGTEFNMQAYSGQTLNVTLVTGRVGVKTAANEAFLRPGENAALTATGLKVEQVDVLKYTSWKNGYFYYDNTRLEEMLEELGRWYDFTVHYEEEALKELQFKFWAGRYEPLERTLMHLNEMQKVKITIEGSCIVVSGYREKEISQQK